MAIKHLLLQMILNRKCIRLTLAHLVFNRGLFTHLSNPDYAWFQASTAV